MIGVGEDMARSRRRHSRRCRSRGCRRRGAPTAVVATHLLAEVADSPVQLGVEVAERRLHALL